MGSPFGVTEGLDISEQGRTADGQIVRLDRRLFMQLHVFGECLYTEDLPESLREQPFGSVLYVDALDPQGVALLTFSEDPDFFVTELRDYLNRPPFVGLEPKPEYTMMGRTYALGNEENLEPSLITRPREKVCNAAMHWAIW